MSNNYPSNPNVLSQVGFRFNIQKLPTVSFFTQSFSIPAVNLGTANVPTPFVNMPVPGDHITYDLLNIRFLVDEDLANYIELYEWMTALGFPDSFDQYKTVVPERYALNGGVYSTGVVEVLDSAKKCFAEIVFEDLYPVNLSSVDFNAKATDIGYIEATASFSFRTFKINKVL